MIILSEVTKEDHAYLSDRNAGDIVEIFDLEFEIMEIYETADQNFLYSEYVVQLLDSDRFFSFTSVLSYFPTGELVYEESMQSYSFIEIEKKEVTTHTWVQKI